MKVETYGLLQPLLGASFDIDASGTVAEVLQQIAERFPEFVPHLERTACAVGDELVQRDHELNPNDQLVLIPPVAGG